MQCLYCGKGIGPIRQIRGASFCSEAHRNKFSDIYRQEAYEALAPAPAPSKCADFIERTPAAAGPAPHSLLRLLTKHFSGERQPAMQVEAAGVWLERPGWLNTQGLAGMPIRLAWQGTAATNALPVRTTSPPMHDCICRLAGGRRGTHLVGNRTFDGTPAGCRGARPSVGRPAAAYGLAARSRASRRAGEGWPPLATAARDGSCVRRFGRHRRCASCCACRRHSRFEYYDCGDSAPSINPPPSRQAGTDAGGDRRGTSAARSRALDATGGVADSAGSRRPGGIRSVRESRMSESCCPKRPPPRPHPLPGSPLCAARGLPG